MNYHIAYTIKKRFHQNEIDLPSLAAAEEWVSKQGASYWEIGVLTPPTEQEVLWEIAVSAAQLKHGS
jgi:hypothetical protein